MDKFKTIMHRQEKVIIKEIIEKFLKLKKLIKLSDEIAQVLHKVLHKIREPTPRHILLTF